MKKTVLVILLLATSIGAFAATRHKKKKKATATNGIASVMVYHSVCYGRCPEYSVLISADGMATYTAMRFTEDTGIFQKNIGRAKAKEIIDQFVAYRVDTCSDRYVNRIPDVPGLTVTVNYPKAAKTIYSANFGPAFLTRLAEQIDEAGKKTDKTDNTWQKTGMPKLN